MEEYDVLVIGSGPAGSSVATKCVKEGKKVAIVDKLFGGTCALRGCTPKKAMYAITSTWWTAQSLQKNGFPIDIKHTVDWKKLLAHKEKFTSLVPAQTKTDFKENGIDVIQGVAIFKDAHHIIVNENTYKAKNIVIATGATPRPLEIEGGDMAITSEDFFELPQLPKKIVIIGGGYIGFELSHIAAACGAKITILSKSEMPLSAFDAAHVTEMVQSTLDKNIDVRLGFEATFIEENRGKYSVYAKRNQEEKEQVFEADIVLNASGRIPAIKQLKVKKANLKLNDKDGIAVNDYLQTTKHNHIYALGDTTGKLPFTEIATFEANTVVHNILNPKKLRKMDYSAVSMAVFTHPVMAMVGSTVDELDEKGVKYIKHEGSLDHFFSQRIYENQFAKYQLLLHEKTNRILGATAIGQDSEHLINLLAIAMQGKIKYEDLEGFLMVYPSSTHDIKHFR